MADLNSSPSNEKPNLDVLFPNLKKSDTALPAPRFMAPTTAAATLLKGAPPSARAVPPPPSLRSKPASVRPPPPSARAPEPIQPVDDEMVDDGPTIALRSPMLPAPIASRPAASSPMPPPSRRAAPPPPSVAKLPPLPSAPSSGKHSAPVAALPPLPAPPPSSLRNAAPPSLPKASPPPLPLPPYTDEDEERVAPPVSSKAVRASAAASLAASSGPVRAYVPPSVLPPVSRPVSAQETIPASRAHSLIPTAASVPPPALPQKKSRGALVAFAAAASLAVLGAAGFAAVKGSAALGLGSAGTGSVAITAAGPGGAKVDGLRVFVDGVVKCDSAPCRLADLSAGTHFVSADAPGFATTAARAVSVERGSEASLHIDLVPTSAAAAPAVEAKPEAKATPIDELAAEKVEKPAQPERSVAASKPEKKDAKKDEAKPADAAKDEAKKAIAGEGGLLNINSIPVANVVLDGRPMGSTPLVGVKVSAGPHSVVFIHPEHGRKASGTTVKAGGTATVAVRF